jgi:thioredoxin 1
MMKIKKSVLGVALLAVIVLVIAYLNGRPRRPADASVPSDPSKAKVTFIELGSVSCIPCRAMQPVMRALEKEYGNQIRIVFHDVWQDDAPAKTYRIRVIPTQVFLDQDGHEFHRHEGFYPLEQIDKLLLARGLKTVNGS